MPEKIKILHIEDNSIIAKLVEEMLCSSKDEQFEIEHFAMLKPALERLDTQSFDLILTDLQLPDSDGLESFQKLHAKVPYTPIVIMTGTYEEEELAVQSLKEGAQDYLRKSEVNPYSLARSVRYSIERQQIKNELKKAYSDLMTTKDRLVQSEKLAGLARFSEGIAHEVRNPLGIVIGGAEVLQKRLSGAEKEIKESVDMIKDAAVRASEILGSFLVYAQSRSTTAEKSDLGAVIKDIAASFRQNGLPANINFTLEVPKEEMCAMVDRAQLKEALRHILTNAADAMLKGGTIAVKAYKAGTAECLDGKPAYVIDVKDTGIGIPEEDMPKVFEPFFTTKVRTVGKGRGLFIAKTVVESFGGKIAIESVTSKGTSVKITLPRCEE